MNTTPVDLRTCKPGQKLRSKQGLILTYIGPTEAGSAYDHEIKYPPIPPYTESSRGTRTHDGFVFRKHRLPEDHDIVEILPFEEEKA
jgi:hypothetical protein